MMLPSKLGEEYLQSKCANSNIKRVIQNTLGSWQFSSDHDLNEIKASLDDVIEAIRQEHFEDSADSNIYKGIHCIIHNFIWDALIPLIRAMFNEEDTALYEKSKHFCKFRKIMDEEDANNSLFTVSFTSAVVELSMIDVYKSPLEMLDCLCTTYDLVFAELKSALVTVISQDSERDSEIPIVNNEEVIFLISKVVMKSQMLHLCSNLFYIKLFGKKILEEDRNMRAILRDFEIAMQKFMGIDESTIETKILKRGINACEMMELSLKEESNDDCGGCTLESEKRKRLVSLVLISTTEKDLVPLDLPKVFT